MMNSRIVEGKASAKVRRVAAAPRRWTQITPIIPYRAW